MANESAQFPLDRGPLRSSSNPVLLRLPAIPTIWDLSPPRRSTVDSWPHGVCWCQLGVFYFEKWPDVVCYFGAWLPVCSMLNSAKLLRLAPASPSPCWVPLTDARSSLWGSGFGRSTGTGTYTVIVIQFTSASLALLSFPQLINQWRTSPFHQYYRVITASKVAPLIQLQTHFIFHTFLKTKAPPLLNH